MLTAHVSFLDSTILYPISTTAKIVCLKFHRRIISYVLLLKNHKGIILLYTLFRLTTGEPSSATIRDLRCTSTNKCEEDPLYDDDEHLCKFKYI